MTRTTSRTARTTARRPGRTRRDTAVGALVGMLVAAVAATAWATTRSRDTGPVEALHADTRLGTVELRVSDLDVQRQYYADVLGLAVLQESDDQVSLGAADEVLVRLVRSDDPRPSSGDAGLYHSAILYPDEASLAEVLQQVATAAPESYQGASDHAVSQAFYFSDPEGNGVELYVDRPRDSWQWDGDRVQMGSAALDPNAFIAEHADGEPAGTPTAGHVHLKVGDLEQAERFYVDTLGFSLTSEVDGAIFLAAGGYHHHLGANTWSSAGAGRRSATTGLGHIQVLLPTPAEVEALADRLRRADQQFRQTSTGLTVADPWGNVIAVDVAPSTASVPAPDTATPTAEELA